MDRCPLEVEDGEATVGSGGNVPYSTESLPRLAPGGTDYRDRVETSALE
jgi:hypothetical protein